MKKIKIFLFLMLCAVLLTACGKEKEEEQGTVIYYLNKDATSISPVAYEVTGETLEKQVEELLSKLEEIPESVE